MGETFLRKGSSDRGDVLRQRAPFSKGVLSIINIKLLYKYYVCV